MSRLKALNVFILQWFFVRLTKHQEIRIEDFVYVGYNMMPDGSMTPFGNGTRVTYQWYSIQYWVVPCTGWWSKFKYTNTKPKFLKITKDRKT